MFVSKIKPPKKTLDDLLSSKEVITGKEVVQNIKEQENRQKEFEEIKKRLLEEKSKGMFMQEQKFEPELTYERDAQEDS